MRRAFDWWVAQMKRALPATIFFFVGINLILWTKLLILPHRLAGVDDQHDHCEDLMYTACDDQNL